jgi:hypothetical protein
VPNEPNSLPRVQWVPRNNLRVIEASAAGQDRERDNTLEQAQRSGGREW